MPFKSALSGIVAAGSLCAAAGIAQATTNAIVVNQTGAEIDVSGVTVADNQATFTALNGTPNIQGPVVSQGSLAFSIHHTHRQDICDQAQMVVIDGEGDGKTCVKAMEGRACLVVVVRRQGASGRYPVQLEQTLGNRCDAEWWSRSKDGLMKLLAGKPDIVTIIHAVDAQ